MIFKQPFNLKAAFTFQVSNVAHVIWMKANKNTAKLTATAILAALVVMLDYAGLKIPFPWMPLLKFDITGVPIALVTLLFGVVSGALTSIIAFLSIVVRSGNYVGAYMKAIAEFSTVIGFGTIKYLPERFKRVVPIVIAIILRVLFMTVANMYVMPYVYMIPWEATLSMLPMIGVFNALQGLITTGLGVIIYERLKVILY